jgi:hypothetical protein
MELALGRAAARQAPSRNSCSVPQCRQGWRSCALGSSERAAHIVTIRLMQQALRPSLMISMGFMVASHDEATQQHG